MSTLLQVLECKFRAGLEVFHMTPFLGGILKNPDTGEIRWGAILTAGISATALTFGTAVVGMGNKLERVAAVQELLLSRVSDLEVYRIGATANKFRVEDADRLKLDLQAEIKRLREDMNDRITREVIRSNESGLPRYKR